MREVHISSTDLGWKKDQNFAIIYPSLTQYKTLQGHQQVYQTKFGMFFRRKLSLAINISFTLC